MLPSFYTPSTAAEGRTIATGSDVELRPLSSASARSGPLSATLAGYNNERPGADLRHSQPTVSIDTSVANGNDITRVASPSSLNSGCLSPVLGTVQEDLKRSTMSEEAWSEYVRLQRLCVELRAEQSRP
jgi:hypothetical protein